jgi:hypothetical protein
VNQVPLPKVTAAFDLPLITALLSGTVAACDVDQFLILLPERIMLDGEKCLQGTVPAPIHII